MFEAIFSLDWVSSVFSRAVAMLVSDESIREYSKPLLVLAIVILIEIGGRYNWRIRYKSKNFSIDTLYYIFYYCGIYQIFFWYWIYSAMVKFVENYTPWLQMNLLYGLHPAIQLVVMIVIFDFIGYWSHRLRHANKYLWAFHAVHHSQSKLTVMTNYRFHFIDETILRLCMFIPLQIMGVGITLWLFADYVMSWFLLVLHSEFNWSYGRLGRILNNPVFHRQHHSLDENLQNRNFSVMFSFWDDLFGTADRRPTPPEKHGLAGDPVPETVIGQLWYPFAEIGRMLRQRETPSVSPAPRKNVG